MFPEPVEASRFVCPSLPRLKECRIYVRRGSRACSTTAWALAMLRSACICTHCTLEGGIRHAVMLSTSSENMAMDKTLSGGERGAPSFLLMLLSTTPGINCLTPHKPTHPGLTSEIAQLSLHPALEAALHLANGDLYSAHFLVRKAQGGAKELDWGHAILHRLEGDWGNAKVSCCRGCPSPWSPFQRGESLTSILVSDSAGTQI